MAPATATALAPAEPRRTCHTRSVPLRAVSSSTDVTTSIGVDDLDAAFATHRRELTAYAYRMLGSGFEAEDAVQETMVRAWKSIDRFEGRASLRSWLYRIATNVCLDMLKSPQRRARPMDLGPASTADSQLGAPVGEHAWVQPVPDALVINETGDPADIAAARESIRLAFVAAMQYLPPKQRAVLILREVLRMRATEVADLLDTSVASVNSALQRARATLDERDPEDQRPTAAADDQELLDRYVDAFEAYDIAALVSLIREDASFSMPPFALWLQGTEDIATWYAGQGIGCKGSKMIATRGNGTAAFGAYKIDPAGGWAPFALQIIEVTDGWITGLHHFLGPESFALFGLPDHLPADA